MGWPDRSLCQMAAVRAEDALSDRARANLRRWCGPWWLFEVELAFEGVVDRFDDLPAVGLKNR